MTTRSAAAIRKHFLDYFARAGHTVVRSSSLIPANDPTLMFTNAGMVQFKDVFTGAEKRPYARACTSQKCMRVSGKHNDLSEVGRTARHHTFFEMLGNFSFGDYFKEEAIQLAWTLITGDLGLDRSRLWVTVFGGEAGIPADSEARQLWLKISGLPPERVLDKGMKDNFWAMGETGPCGPCTEIHYDQGGPDEPSDEDFETGRVVEIWNNVFMQFERRAGGEMLPLPKPSVDTGMGLERLTAVLQGERSNYHTDLFLPILETIAAAAHKHYTRGDGEDDISMRVIADHARATAFLVADGLQPANDGRGYVMRRIMRRAIRHGKRLGFDELFFHRACEAVVDTMGDSWPELVETRALISKVAETEEKSFRRTLDTGLGILEEEIGKTVRQSSRVLPGATVFKLYDTYGFPRDLTEVIAEEHGLTVDAAGFEREMAAQQERSRGSEVGSAAVAAVYKQVAGKVGRPRFVGYTHEEEPLESREGTWRRRVQDGKSFIEMRARVVALLQDGAEVAAAAAGDVEVVLDPTPFYGESGGQVGDRGVIGGDGLELEVIDSQKPVEGLTVARGKLRRGRIQVGQEVWAGYHPEERQATRAHHSATHILHASLRQVLGAHVKQSGSLVDPEHLRFDYSHFEAPTPEQLKAVEEDANRRVQARDAVVTEVLPFEVAKQRGAMALFGEKYGDTVRVLTMGGSVELCGGTHARNTGDIDLILITREEAVAAGVRRIEAEVAAAARRRVRRTVAALAKAAGMLAGTEPLDVPGEDPILPAVAKAVRTGRELRRELEELGAEPAGKIEQPAEAPRLPEDFGAVEARAVRDVWQGLVQMANARAPEAEAIAERLAAADSDGILRALATLLVLNRDSERRLEQARARSLTTTAGDLVSAAREVKGIRVLATRVDGIAGKELRDLADRLRDKLGSGVLCLGGKADDKATLLIAVTKDLTGRLQAGGLIKELAPIIGGKGGGKPELAQAGGTDPESLDKLFARLEELVAGAA